MFFRTSKDRKLHYIMDLFKDFHYNIGRNPSGISFFEIFQKNFAKLEKNALSRAHYYGGETQNQKKRGDLLERT